MPTFEIALDDGRKFHVEAESQDAALAGIQQHISQPKQGGGILDAARAGASDLVSGLGETASRDLGLNGVGEALKSAGEKIAPAVRPNSTLYDEQGFHAGNIPAALAEASPSAAAAIGAARLTPGPIWAKLAAGGAVGLGSMLGLYTKEATEKRTGDKNAASTQEDVIEGLKRAAPEAAVQALPLGRFVPGQAARLGLKGVVGSLGRTAVDAAAMGAGSGAAQGYDQLYQNGDVDPTQVIDAAARGAVTGGAFGAKRTLGDVKAAIKYRGIADEDPSHIAEASNRIFQSADNLGVNLKSAKGGGQALESARSDVETEFKNAVDRIKGSGEDKNVLSPEAQNALARAQKGLPLSDADTAVLTAASGDEGAVADLQRLGGVSRVLEGVKGTGHFNERTGSLTGGLSGAMEHHVRALANPLGAGVSAGLATVGGAHLGDVFAHSPEALAALGGAYGLARLSDFATGSRSPAGAFASRFATGGPSPITPSQVGSGAGQSTLDQMASGARPTGPEIPQAPQPWGPTPPAPANTNPDPVQLVRQMNALVNARKAFAAQKANEQKQNVAQALPLLQKLAAQNAPQPEAPPQLPQFNPIALKMMREGLQNPPQAPQPAPEAPAPSPQFNPIAMKMLLDKLKSPPQAPQAPAVNAPAAALPQPVIRTPQVADNAPAPVPMGPAPEAVAAPPPAPTKVTKTEKNGVKVEAAKSELGIPEDLSIPDFLKRLPQPITQTPRSTHEDYVRGLGAAAASEGPTLQPVVAKRAMEKLAAYKSVPKGEMKSDEVLGMSHDKYADYKLAQLEDAGKPARMPEAYREATIERRSWKEAVAHKLAEMFPQFSKKDSSALFVGNNPTHGRAKSFFFKELESTNIRKPIEQLREHLKALDPSKADAVDELLSDAMLTRVWPKVGKAR